MSRAITTFLKQTLLITSGSLVYAFAVKTLIVPQDLLANGLTGFALLIYYQWPALPLGAIYIAINVPIFALGWRFVGKRFVAYSLWGLSVYSTALSVIRFELEISNPLLAVLVAAALSGSGTAIILKSYGSSGGADILCVVMTKLFSTSLGTGSIILNAVLLVWAAFMVPIETVLYTVLYIFVAAHFTDKIFRSLTARRSAIIISVQWPAIIKALAENQIRTTRLPGSGGFQGGEQMLLFSIITARRVSELKRIVASIDKDAFIAITTADDVTGVEVGNQPHW